MVRSQGKHGLEIEATIKRVNGNEPRIETNIPERIYGYRVSYDASSLEKRAASVRLTLTDQAGRERAINLRSDGTYHWRNHGDYTIERIGYYA